MLLREERLVSLRADLAAEAANARQLGDLGIDQPFRNHETVARCKGLQGSKLDKALEKRLEVAF
jgi:hypothetical protein